MNCNCGNPAKVGRLCWCCYRRLRGKSEYEIERDCPKDEVYVKKEKEK